MRPEVPMAILPVLPPGYPGALRAALGRDPDPEVLAQLHGQLVADGEDWRLADLAGRERWLAAP